MRRYVLATTHPLSHTPACVNKHTTPCTSSFFSWPLIATAQSLLTHVCLQPHATPRSLSVCLACATPSPARNTFVSPGGLGGVTGPPVINTRATLLAATDSTKDPMLAGEDRSVWGSSAHGDNATIICTEFWAGAVRATGAKWAV